MRAPDSSRQLKGWREIAAFLGEPVSVVQRWAAEGMPLRRIGRFVTTSQEELNDWLGKDSGKPVHVATETTDLSAELKRGLSFIRHGKNPSQQTSGLSDTRKRSRQTSNG